MGSYADLFPSASLKCNLTRNLDLLLGYSSTIRRPPYGNVAGVWTINETNRTVTLPNAALKPETSDNYAARLAYYFEPVGQLSATFTERKVEKLFFTDTLTAEEFGYTGDDELRGYNFVTTSNATDTIRIRSMELEYNQSLAKFGPLFRPFGVRAGYTRIYAAVPRANLTPHLTSGGLNFTYKRMNAYGNWTWADNYNTNLAGTNFRRHRSNLDVGGGWRLTNNYSLSVSVRNLLNTPFINMQTLATGPTVIQRHEIVGQLWTLAIRGTY
jgi:outer membrane receptor protein involved in Fe transport